MSTIAAISTAPGIGGIGIIRLSGEDTFKIIEKIFIPKNKNKEIKGYTFKYGHIINPKTNEILDEVLVSYFINPNSYTTENMCEINSHGGNIVMENILEVCLEQLNELNEPTITARTVTEIMKKTNRGLIPVKEALRKTNGNIEEAIEILKGN